MTAADYRWLRSCRLVADPDLRRPSPEILVGGAPVRVLKLGARAVRILDEILGGGRMRASDQPAGKMVLGMVRAGMLHPVFDPGGGRDDAEAPPPLPSAAVVIPVYNQAASLPAAVSAGSAVGPVVVVDDASTDRSAEAAERAGASVIRRLRRGGPAAARNDGAAAAGGGVIFFLDADCIPEPDCLRGLLAHFADPGLGAAAPRVLGVEPSAAGWLDRYEAVRSPLDMGPRSGPVRPDSRVGYVPTPTLAVRRAAFADAGGFDIGLSFGEDVDFVWRLGQAGWAVRYDASLVSRHLHRRRPLEIVRRRWAYGTAAGPLAERHPDSLASVRASPWTLAAWSAVILRRPGTAALLFGWSWLGLRRALRSAPGGGKLSVRLFAGGALGAARPLASALTRSWGPLTLAAIALLPRLRRRLLLLAAAGMAAEWWERRPGLDPIRYSALAAVDDLVYCGGVWEGCIRARRLSPLLPRTGRPRAGARREPRRTHPRNDKKIPPDPSQGY